MNLTFSGITVRRVIDRAGGVIPSHAHDWPVLSLFSMGGYRNETELGTIDIGGPSAVWYRAGAHHRNTVGPIGFEQIEIEFDPDCIGRDILPDAAVMHWTQGQAAAELHRLAETLGAPSEESVVRSALRQFFIKAQRSAPSKRPNWLEQVEQRLRADNAIHIKELAVVVGLHPAWLGTAYKRATGESLQRTAARFRVERAAHLLRETCAPAATIALDAGFCDQSHMIRTFRSLLGRSPRRVRAEQSLFRPASR